MAQYDGQLMDEEELNFLCSKPVWQGFVTQTDDLIMLGDGKVLNDNGRLQLEDVCMCNILKIEYKIKRVFWK